MKIKNYKVFDFIGVTDIQKLSKKKAREKFDLFLAHKNERIAELKKLTEGELTLEYDVNFRFDQGMVPEINKRDIIKTGIDLDLSEQSLQALNEWVLREAKNSSVDFKDNANFYYDLDEYSSWVPSLWKSIITDCAIYLAEILIKKNPSLYWFFDEKAPKRVDNRYYPSIKGFSNAHEKYYISYVWEIYMHIYRELLGKMQMPKNFVYQYSSSMEII